MKIVHESTVRLPRDRDLRTPELKERFARAERAQLERRQTRWLEHAIAAGTKKPAALPSNVLTFGGRG